MSSRTIEDEDDGPEAYEGYQEADEADDDLLEPSLGENFDVRRFGALFDPSRILWSCFLGGPIGGAILFGLNYRRMREPRWAWLVWIGSVLFTTVLGIGAIWVVGPADQPRMDPSQRGLLRFVFIGASLGMGWLIERHQRGRFDAYIHARRRPRALLVPGIAACVTGIFLTLSILVAIMTWLFPRS